MPPLAAVKVEAHDIESYGCVEKAFWSEDEQFIHYAYELGCEGGVLKWAAYNLATHSTKAIPSPVKYDPGIWRRLNVPDPFIGSGLYPELQGYMSPSGKYIIYKVVYGNPLSLSTPYPYARTEVWLAESNGRRKTRLFTASVGIISQAIWLKNESQVIFDFGYEGGVELNIADVQKGTVVSLAAMTEYKEGTEQEWTVSPDGTMLAIVDHEPQLWLVSLENGRAEAIDQFVTSLYWSKDSKRLYYLWGPSYRETDALRAYDVTSGGITTLVSRSSFQNASDAFPFRNIAVSSGEDKIMFWGGRIQLVELRK